MQPNLQGRIFDSMYALESSVFKDTMQLYIFFQVINVAFRVLRQIFMSIVDRRVRYRVRTILFTSIIRQVRFLTEILDDFRRFVDEIWRF